MAEPALNLFTDFARRPEEHFRICFFGSILGLIEGVTATAGSFERALERFPFLAGYNNELADRVSGLSSSEALQRWRASLEEWEDGVPVHLPLRALRQAAGLTHAEILWLLTLGLIEEDARFGVVFEALQGSAGQRRPTLGFMSRCLSVPQASHDPVAVLAGLCTLGALEILNPDAPRQEWVFHFSNLAWDVLRTSSVRLDSERLRYRPPKDALALDELVLPSSVKAQIEAMPAWLGSKTSRCIVLRGPHHNGRRTILGAVARARGQGVLEILPPQSQATVPSSNAGILAVLLNAMPILELTAAPGEAAVLPELQPDSLCLGVALGARGSLTGTRVRDAVIVDLPLLGLSERRQLWRRTNPNPEESHVDNVVHGFRLTSGNIVRAGTLAGNRMALEGRAHLEVTDVLEATRVLERQGLDLLAHRLPSTGDLNRLCTSERTREELEHLARRCRHREALTDALEQAPAGALSCGVRALFTGPTGTGKTLAARLLAGTLQRDLYRLDLSAVVNKFIGETEKNLHRLFAYAEELDVILLLDEGDALLTRRTDVQNANDRYANLETNFLLQRLESFQGILIVTTNARDRIDSAFERRMDVVVEFGVPSAEERLELWQRHLPAASAIDPQRLAEAAAECELTGGQIHNAVLHAALLALDNGGTITSDYFEAALRREYRKRGGVCPLRPHFP